MDCTYTPKATSQVRRKAKRAGTPYTPHHTCAQEHKGACNVSRDLTAAPYATRTCGCYGQAEHSKRRRGVCGSTRRANNVNTHVCTHARSNAHAHALLCTVHCALRTVRGCTLPVLPVDVRRWIQHRPPSAQVTRRASTALADCKHRCKPHPDQWLRRPKLDCKHPDLFAVEHPFRR